MPTELTRTGAEETGFRLTGRHVLLILFCFFGTVFAVNFTMARLALTTFRGEAAEHAYEEGLHYNRTIAQAQAQNARGWKVDGQFAVPAPGRAQLELSALDGAGAPLTGLEWSVRLEAPTDRRRDRELTVVEYAPGRYRAEGAVVAGQWEAALVARRGDDILYQSRNRVNLR